MIKLTHLLLEVSLDQLKTQYVDTGKITDSEFTEIIDSAGGKTAYATWLAKKVSDKIIKPEDLYKYNAYFKIFDRRKREYTFQDINQYKTVQDLAQFISKSVELANMEKSDPSQQKGVAKSDKYREFYIGSVSGFNVYKLPKDRKDLYSTSCELGSGTEWCTATGKTERHFENYISQGPLFIFIKPGSDEKYQFSYETNSFMDKNDRSIDTKNTPNYIYNLLKFIETNQSDSKYRIPFDIKLNNAPDTITKDDLNTLEKRFIYKILIAPNTITKDDLNVDGSLTLADERLKSLPDNLTVNGSLILTQDESVVKLKKLPDNLTVNGDLIMEGGNIFIHRPETPEAAISSIPNNLNVNGNLYLGNNWFNQLEVPEIRKTIQDKGGHVDGTINGHMYSDQFEKLKARLGRNPIYRDSI